MDLACTNNQIDLQSPSTSSVRCVAHTHWNYLRIGTPVAELENTRPNYIAAQCVYPPSVVFPSSCLVPSTPKPLPSWSPSPAQLYLHLVAGTEWSWSDWKIISAKGVSEEMNIDWPAGCCWSVSLYYELAAALWTDESEQQTLTEGEEDGNGDEDEDGRNIISGPCWNQWTYITEDRLVLDTQRDVPNEKIRVSVTFKE